MELSAHASPVLLDVPEVTRWPAGWCLSPLPTAEALKFRVEGSGEVIELFPRVPCADQMELAGIARDLKERYAGAMREVVLELTREQVASIANAVQAHRTGRRFYHQLGGCLEVMEKIVIQWVERQKQL